MNDDQSLSRIGRTMFLFVWIIIFAGFFLFFYFYGQNNTTPELSSARELILRADKNGHYWIDGSLNNLPVRFLVDTGATLVAIPQNIADKLPIKGRYPMTIYTANGEITGSLTRIPELKFGEFTLHDVKAVITPASDTVVLLGMNVLAQFNITQEDKRLILKNNPSNLQ
jgi:aspartyl protease family protein